MTPFVYVLPGRGVPTLEDIRPPDGGSEGRVTADAVRPVTGGEEVVTYANTRRRLLRKTAGTDRLSQLLPARGQHVVHDPRLPLLADLGGPHDASGEEHFVGWLQHPQKV